MADNLSPFLHHEIQFRNKVRVAAVPVQHIMLRTSGAVHIPKGLAREVLHLTEIGGCFKPDDHSTLARV